MLAFELISPLNEMVECMAFGWNADSTNLAQGHKVAVQGVQSRKGHRGENSRLWIYDDSVVAVLSEGCSVPAGKMSPVALVFTA